MIKLKGKGVSGGMAKGTLLFYRPQTVFAASTGEARDIAAEKARFEKAQQESIEQLNALAEKCLGEAGEEMAALFETHAMFVEDESYVDCIMETLEAESCGIEAAVQKAGEVFSDMFAQMDDAYMRERAADIRDVTQRLLQNLTGKLQQGIASQEPVILAADDLTPSETMQMDRSKILAFATRKGSANSHTAILAGVLGIPAVCALGDALEESCDGKLAYIDGDSGELILEPDEETCALLEQKRSEQEAQKTLLATMVGQENVTLDGKRVDIFCNIGTPEDVEAVLRFDGGGIGLFRSEFLYLGREDYPSEETQFAAYRAVLERMGEKTVIIRTLDIGADKQVDYFGLRKEENPAMGMRAIRLCLERPEVFHTQLRALYRASAFGKLAIMFPMITSVWELRECRAACARVMEELQSEHIDFDREVKLGIMIETPAAVFMAAELAKEADFFSVGTNDLTQYTLACDRQCSELGRFFDPHHPAVLRAIALAAEAAHKEGKWIGICGELAADAELLPRFLEMGIDELSVAPPSVLPLRKCLRSLDMRKPSEG